MVLTVLAVLLVPMVLLVPLVLLVIPVLPVLLLEVRLLVRVLVVIRVFLVVLVQHWNPNMCRCYNIPSIRKQMKFLPVLMLQAQVICTELKQDIVLSSWTHLLVLDLVSLLLPLDHASLISTFNL